MGPATYRMRGGSVRRTPKTQARPPRRAKTGIERLLAQLRAELIAQVTACQRTASAFVGAVRLLEDGEGFLVTSHRPAPPPPPPKPKPKPRRRRR
jgi:hypothetical protein